MKDLTARFFRGPCDRFRFRLQRQLRFSLSRSAEAAMLCLLFAAAAYPHLAVPEFFGFYALEGDGNIALYEGKGSRPVGTVAQDVYSIPHNGTQTYTVSVVSPSVRFLLFYANAGEMMKSMTLHRLPLVRNIIENPDPNQRSMAMLSGKPIEARVIGTPNRPLLARIPDLEIRILSKPVPNQPQMIELVPDATLVPGLYIFDYSPAPGQGWHVVLAVRSASERESPLCLDLILPGGFGGMFERANSELNDAVPALASYRYKTCDSPGAPNTSALPAPNPTGGPASANAGAQSTLTSAWDQALNSGQPVVIGLCRDRGGFIVRPCEPGSLSLDAKQVTFTLAGGQSVFAASPAQLALKRDPNLEGVFWLEVGGKKSRFQYVPVGLDCPDRMGPFLACPPEGVAQQVAVADYLSRTLRKVASGNFSGVAQ
jgi:hypothetical protein